MKTTPLIHVTDLAQPPWDCDDQVDLAVCYALPELDLKAVILDWRGRYEDRGAYEPAFCLVTQINWMTGSSVPAAVGPHEKLQSPEDDGTRFPRVDQAGIQLILDTLRQAPEPAWISIVGSCRAVAAAFNRDPGLFRQKVRAILMGAGVALRVPGDRLDPNSSFDPHAFVRLMRSGLPIHWFPPSNYLKKNVRIRPTEAEATEASRHHCKFLTPHATLFRDLPKRLFNWLMFGFSGSQRGDIIRALHDDWGGCLWWGIIGPGKRCVTHLPMFIAAAGRKLARTADGWRFLPKDQPAQEEFPLDQFPVEVKVGDDAHTEWRRTDRSNILILDHPPCLCEGEDFYAQTMSEALNALLRDEMPMDAPAPKR